MILVGALETELLGTDGEMHTMGRPHREAENCWDDVDYLNVLRYHVVEGDDVIASDGLRPNADPAAKRDWEVVRMRDAHVFVREEQLVDLIEEALANIDTNRG